MNRRQRLFRWLGAYTIICAFLNHEGRGLHWTKPDGSVWCYSVGLTVKPKPEPEPEYDVVLEDDYTAGLYAELLSGTKVSDVGSHDACGPDCTVKASRK